MEIKLPILDLSDVEKAYDQINKIKEEYLEFNDAAFKSDEELSELYDIIQACIGYIQMYHKSRCINGAEKHYNKLASRKRKIIGNIKISIEYDD